MEYQKDAHKKLILALERRHKNEKLKFIALILTLVTVVASLAVAISAAQNTNHYAPPPTMTMDGIMGADEGWSDATVFDFNMHVLNATGETFVKRENRVQTVTGSSSIRFRNDNEYLYIYYETSNSDTLTQAAANGGLILRIVPQNNVDMQNSVYTDGTYMHLWLNVANSLAFLNEDKVGSIYDFTFTDEDHTAWGLGIKTPVNQFGFKGWYDSYGDYSSAFAKKTTIALHVEKENNVPIKKAYEIKMPLPSMYKNRLGSEEPTFYFSAYERSRQYNGSVAEAEMDGSTVINEGTSNSGYLISTNGTTPVSWGYSDVGFKDNSMVTAGIPVTLTKFVDPNAPETTAPETTKAPAATTKAPETTKAAETTAAPAEEKGGCGSSIALTSIAIVATVGTSAIVVCKKRKDD